MFKVRKCQMAYIYIDTHVRLWFRVALASFWVYRSIRWIYGGHPCLSHWQKLMCFQAFELQL